MRDFKDMFDNDEGFEEFHRALQALLLHHGLEGIDERGELVFDAAAIVRGMKVAIAALDDLRPDDEVVNRDLVLLVQDVLRCIAAIAESLGKGGRS